MDLLGWKARADLTMCELHAASLRTELDEARTTLQRVREVVESPSYRDDAVAQSVLCYLNGIAS